MVVILTPLINLKHGVGRYADYGGQGEKKVVEENMML